MALSDYLTSDEWDACFYVMMSPTGQSRYNNLGDAMHAVIDAALAKGYRFPGLTETGAKHVQLRSGNASKLLIWFGNKDNVDVRDILNHGREWIKQNLPEWIAETDDEWAQALA